MDTIHVMTAAQAQDGIDAMREQIAVLRGALGRLESALDDLTGEQVAGLINDRYPSVPREAAWTLADFLDGSVLDAIDEIIGM